MMVCFVLQKQQPEQEEGMCMCVHTMWDKGCVFLFSQEHFCHLSASYACVQATTNTICLSVLLTIGFSC